MLQPLLLLLLLAGSTGHVLPLERIRRSGADQTRSALMAFYAATQGHHWTNNTGWNGTASCCVWHGVSCDAVGVPELLQLNENSINGTLAQAVGGLTTLMNLQLERNLGLKGTIPMIVDMQEWRTT